MKRPDFVAANSDSFPLGDVRGFPFEAVVSRKSCFAGFGEYTDLPCLHIAISPTSETLTWHTWKELVGGAAVILQAVEHYLPEIVAHFFGNALSLEDAGWRIEWNSPKAARRQTVHFHLEIAHKDLFGEDGKIRQCVESLLKPKIITENVERKTIERVMGRSGSGG